MAARVFLALSTAIWLPYGLYCFVAPGALAEVAGVGALGSTGTIELRAMYGGLQTAIGTLALAGALRESLRSAALWALLFLCAGLALARAAGALLDAELSAYTTMGLAFEVGSAALAAWLLRREEAIA